MSMLLRWMGIRQMLIGIMATATTATVERRAIRADALTGTNDASIHQLVDTRQQNMVPTMTT